MAIEPQRFEESLLEYAFGDGALDPAFLVDEAAHRQAYRQRIDELIDEIRLLKRTTGKPVDSSVAVARLRALAQEADRARPVGAVDLAAARARRRARTRWMGVGAGVALAAGLALLVWMRSGTPPEAPPLDDAAPGEPVVAELWSGLSPQQAEELAAAVEDAGLGFAGPEALDPFARGWLAAVVMDLATPSEVEGEPGEEALRVADAVAARVFAGISHPPTTPEERRRRVLAGCAALMGERQDIATCRHGQFAYRLHRDLTLERTGDAQVRAASPAADRFLAWVMEAPVGTAVKEIAARLQKAEGAPTSAELSLWERLVADPDAFAPR